ncbi:MAG: hypothetical protein XD79_0797, partial [Atribacteria bacterium 34_128]
YDTSNRKKVKLTGEIIDKIKFYLRENETKRAEVIIKIIWSTFLYEASILFGVLF